MMDLFSYSQQQAPSPGTPLAELLRPKDLDSILGQSEYMAKGKPFRKLLEEDRLPSLIIWGPPGCGKTSLASVIAKATKKEFIALNAIDAGSKVLKEQGEAARHRRLANQISTVVFVDEIHRLNKAQQDVLLPFVEKGDFTLIGATTENPSFQVNSALLSRCRLLVFHRLESKELKALAQRAFDHYGIDIKKVLTDESAEVVFQMADGDGRRLLNLVEQSIAAYQQAAEGILFPVEKENLGQLLGSKSLYHDRSGDMHYDTISAFIKSIRGSDPSAGVYYLARMLEGGEDPLFIARRLVILASEDVGNADPRALQVAIAGMQAVELVGLPEAAINLSQVVTYLASAPKSNRSYEALRAAQAEVKKSGLLSIPLSVRNAPTSMMKGLGYGSDYQYAHNGEKGWLEQQFLPDEIKSKVFYEPSERGFEKQIKAFLEWLKARS